MFVPTREQGLYLYVNRACVNRACVHTIESCPVECSLPCPVSFSSSVKCPESLDVVRPASCPVKTVRWTVRPRSGSVSGQQIRWQFIPCPVGFSYDLTVSIF